MPPTPWLRSSLSEGSLYSVESIGDPWYTGVLGPLVRYAPPTALYFSFPTHEQS